MIKTITFVALLWITLLHTQPVHGTFGNEYVHIKVHLPKEHTPTIVEPVAPHKVIHHYHHKTKARSRAPKKPTGLQSPLLESVILSELDKPSHANEHAEYLNHAKELAEHIAKPVETYVVKKQLPPPPKKIVNTYAIIEEKIKPHHEHHVETFKVIETKLPIHQHQRHNHGYNQDEYEHEHEQEHEDYDYAYKQTTSHQTHYDDSVDHEYEPAQSHYEPHEHRVTHNRHHLRAAYAEPAPVEEAPESDDEYGYQPQPYQPQLQQQQQQHYYYGRQTKYTNKQPSESLTVPGEDAGIDNYYGASVDTVSGIADAYSYNKRPSSPVLDSFRPSPQVHDAQKSSYDDYSLVDSYLATKRAPTHSASYSRPLASEIEWPAATGYNSAATKTYSGIDSYSAGHGQDIESGNYQYASPYE